MIINIGTENEELLKSIIENEGWKEPPAEKNFFDTIDKIINDTQEDYKGYAIGLKNLLKKYDYKYISEYIKLITENQV